MDIKKELDNTAKQVLKDKKKLLIGMLLTMPIPLISLITYPILQGYILRYMQGIVKKKHGLPGFQDSGKLWVRGFLLGVINLFYLLPLGVIIVVLIFVDIKTSIFYLLIPLVFISLYFLEYAKVEYAYKENFWDAIAFWSFIKKVVSIDYFRLWISMMSITIVSVFILLGFILGIQNLVKNDFLFQIILIIFAGIIAFPFRIFCATVFAKIYVELNKKK